MSWKLVESDRIIKCAELSDFTDTEMIIPKEYGSFFGKEGERLALIYQNREYPAYLETEGGNTKLKWSKVLVRKLGEAFPQYQTWFNSEPDETETPEFEIIKKNDGFHIRLVKGNHTESETIAEETSGVNRQQEPQSGLRELLKKWIVGYPNYYPRDFRFSFKDIIIEEIPGVLESFERIKNGNYRITGFAGDLQWAEIPWVKVWDRSIQQLDGDGLYLAYILAMDSRKIYLVLAYDQNGAGIRSLSEKAADFRKVINTEKYQTNHKDVLLTNATLVSSIVCYREYTEETMPEDAVLAEEFEDFRKMYALCLLDQTGPKVREEFKEEPELIPTTPENQSEDEDKEIITETKENVIMELDTSSDNEMTVIEKSHQEPETIGLSAVETATNSIEAAALRMDEKEAEEKEEITIEADGNEIRQIEFDPAETRGEGAKTNLESAAKPTNAEQSASSASGAKRNGVQHSEIPSEEQEKIVAAAELARYPVANDYLNPVLQSVQAKMGNRGFFYPAELIKNYYLSIKSKPFVIIKGRIGSGKTTFPRLFAEAVGATLENRRFVRVLVGKNWEDDSGLFGRLDSRGHFIPGPVMMLLKNARDYPEKPHFLLLDEMDQSKVMDYLRILLDGINGSHETLRTREDFGGDVGAYREFGNIIFPDNVYVIGTLNKANGSYPLEPRVIDCGNVIEMPIVEIGAFPNYGSVTNETEWDNSQFKIKNKVQGLPEILEKLMYRLSELQEILKKYHYPLGYRGKNEILTYGINSGAEGLFTENEVIDFAILQRILPALDDSSGQMALLLKELGLFLLEPDLKDHLLKEESGETFEKLYQKLLDQGVVPCHRSGQQLLKRLKQIESA